MIIPEKSPLIKLSYIIYIFLFTYFSFSCQNTDNTNKSQQEITNYIEEVKSKLIPDRRVQIFDYEISENGQFLKGKTSNQPAYQKIKDLVEIYPEINIDSFHYIEPIGYGIVKVSVCNMRSNPKHSAELSTQALLGHPLTVWDQKGDWYYVQSPDKYLGWLDAGAFSLINSEKRKEYQELDKIMYRKDFGFCYSEPNLTSDIVSDLVAGDIMVKLEIQDQFYYIEFPDQRKGYVLISECFDENPFSENDQLSWSNIEKTAKQFMGRPYLWGGTSGKGVDCSGFTKMVYYLNGLILPRDASQQVNVGKELILDEKLSQLKEGDFLFFGTKGENGQRDRITHVAIHLQDGKIIHAAERVQIESLNPKHSDYNEYRRNTLLSARRMIDNQKVQPGITYLSKDPNYAWK